MKRLVVAFLAVMLTTGCGGGGDNSPPAPINRPPVITSAATAAVPENTAGPAYQAAATDPDGDVVTYRLEGGDAARFTLTAGGAISFVAAPNFEAPADTDANNIYQIILVASDGAMESRLNVSITVTNAPDQLAARQVVNQSKFAAAATGTDGLFTGRLAGALDGSRFFEIFLVDPAPGGTQTLYLTIRDIFSTQFVSEYGVLNVVAAPDYATSGMLYVLLTNPDRDIELRRYGRLASGLGNPNGDVILRIPGNRSAMSVSLGGGLAFGPDNLLYIGVGEGRASGADPDLTAQDLSSMLGKILRIDVRRDDYPADPDRDYGIPTGNPFATGIREIYAYGLDNPRRMNFDGQNLLIGDALESVAFIERPDQEINLLRPQDAGANFGFPYGTFRFPTPPAGTTPPVIRVSGTNNSNIGRVTGGYVYRGPITQLDGQYLFAEMATRSVWAVPAANIVQGHTITQSGLNSLNALLPTDIPREVLSFGLDGSNNLYFVSAFTGQGGPVYVLELR